MQWGPGVPLRHLLRTDPFAGLKSRPTTHGRVSRQTWFTVARILGRSICVVEAYRMNRNTMSVVQ